VIAGDGRLALEPIGFFRSAARHKNEARRQGSLDASGSEGAVELLSGRGLEEALRDLAGFERAWIIYGFHLSSGWKPLVRPPRGPLIKRGLFATRAPYRPNPIGLSCVRLLAVEPLLLRVSGHDVLDGSPVYDIKPYLPYSDAFPQSQAGWIEGLNEAALAVSLAPLAERQVAWLEARGVARLREFLLGQLAHEPLDGKRKRVGAPAANGRAAIAYRTWRAEFRVVYESAPQGAGNGSAPQGAGGDMPPLPNAVVVERIFSGYSASEARSGDDPYGDKSLHLAFAEFELY
jgi:tRNA-Thr(GGU) m(6)t(6)A37 methyltransferase TsaA